MLPPVPAVPVACEPLEHAGGARARAARVAKRKGEKKGEVEGIRGTLLALPLFDDGREALRRDRELKPRAADRPGRIHDGDDAAVRVLERQRVDAAAAGGDALGARLDGAGGAAPVGRAAARA